MQYNKPLVAGLLGALSTVTAEILTRGLVFLGFGKYSDYQLDSMLITVNRPSSFLGLGVNFIIGGFAAVVLYYLLKKIGEDYIIIKSVFTGLLAWAVTELLITTILEGKTIEVRPMGDYYNHILGAITYGATLGLLFKRYLVNRHTI